MMRSLFSAISGMRNHMSFMDVVGNNIANVNTTAYKSSAVTFEDILGQTVRGASAPQNGRGGTNPAQVGLGMALGGIESNMGQGSLQSTGKLTDFAVQGDGFFVISDGQRNNFTRDGSFNIDVSGTLVNGNGMKVMGWEADSSGNVDTTKSMQALTIPFGTQVSAHPTADASPQPATPIYGMTAAGNLDSGAAAGTVVASTVQAYDSLGNAHSIELKFTKGATANQWTVEGTADGGTAGNALPGTTQLNFTANGQIDTTTGSKGLLPISITLANGATTPLAFTLDVSKMTQFAGNSQISPQTNTGAPAGALVSFAVGSSGEISGIYSNGASQKIGQLALASFVNPAGLQREGNNLWADTGNSGQPLIGTPNSGGRGTVSTGTLETSNVDLSQQFTNMIIAQRGFEASSKVVTASDQMLQSLVNMIR